MDESLNFIQQMKAHAENLSAKQQAQAKKMKESKGMVAKLREQASTMQGQINTFQAEHEQFSKSGADLQAQMDKLQQEHAALHAAQTRVKSSLDAAQAAHEEYRKGCNSLRAALKKAKEDVQKKEEELEEAKKVAVEVDKTKAEIRSKEENFMENLTNAQDTLKTIMARQKKNSKAVLDRMLAGQAGVLRATTFAAWARDVKATKEEAEIQKTLGQVEAKLAANKNKKKEEAKQVLDRMSAASDSGLAGLVFQTWAKHVGDQKQTRQEAEKLQGMLKNKKAEARKALEKQLGSTSTGILTSALKDWINHFVEWKKENEMKTAAEAALKEYQQKKRGEAMSVVERMNGLKASQLIMQVFILWSMDKNATAEIRAMEAAMAEKHAKLKAEAEELRKVLAEKAEDIEDVEEELAESRKKNQLLREEFKGIMSLQDSMELSMKELDGDDD